MEPQNITLYYREGSTDKVYQASLEQSGDLWVCNFAYGRRGSTMSTGTKTPKPVEYALAKKAYDKVVTEKKAKGYTEGETGALYAGTSKEERKTGIVPQLLNNVDEDQLDKLFGDDNFWMQEKKDGKRIELSKEGQEVTGINRLGLSCGIPQSIVSEAQMMGSDFLIDGEAVGEILYCFDIRSLGGRSLEDRPYSERYEQLLAVLGSPDKPHYTHLMAVPTYQRTGQKKARFEILQFNKAEGVVFKDKNAPYKPGRPNSGGPQLKFKFVQTASFIVSKHHGTKRSVHLLLLDGDNEVDVGKVTIPPNYDMPEPGDIVEVRYLYAYKGGAVYQPVYQGKRDDLERSACVLTQLKFKAEGEEES